MSGKNFEGVADTLYIPLTARVFVSKRFPEYFFDPKSLELESAIPGESIQAPRARPARKAPRETKAKPAQLVLRGRRASRERPDPRAILALREPMAMTE